MERTGALIKSKYLEYFLSTLAMSGSTVIANIIDRIMVGDLIGAREMSAISLTSPMVFIVNVVYGLYIYGGNTLAAIYKGRRDNKNANKSFTIAILGGMGVCLLMTVAGLALIEPLTRLFSVNDETLYRPVYDYLLPQIFMGALVILVNGTAAFVRSDGLKGLSLAIPVVSNAVNLLMDYVFMGILGYGIGSAGWATNIGLAAAVVFVIPYFRSEKRTVFFNIRGLLDLILTLDIFRTGLASALLNASLLLKNYIMNTIVVSLYGGAGAEIMSVCLSGNSIANIFYMGTSQTMLPIGGALYGEKDYNGIRYLLKTASCFTLGICASITAVFCIFPDQFAAMFNVNVEEIKDLYEPAFRIFSLSIPFVGMQNIVRSFLQSCGYKNSATVMMILDGTLFFIPVIYLLSVTAPTLMWISFTSAPVLSVTAVYVFMLVRLRKQGIGVSLMPRQESETPTFELTFENNITDVEKSSEEILGFCRNNGISDNTGNKIWLCVQELCSNIARYAYGNKNGYADIFLRLTDTEVILRIRNNGVIFNPTEFIDDSGREITGLGLLRAIKIKLEYNRVVGFNNTIVTIPRQCGVRVSGTP